MPLSHEGALQGYARNIGGSAGTGTHGGTAVQRPEEMPTREEATHHVSTASDFRTAVQQDGAIVYLDETVTLQSSQPIELGSNVQIVGGYCDPEIPGRGPIIEQDYYVRKTFVSEYQEAPTLWGVSMRGPNTDLESFDPRKSPYEEGDTDRTDWYAGGIHCKDTTGTFTAIGCEFWGWTIAGIELGATADGRPKYPTDAEVRRCTFHHNNMETFGYGIEQYCGHLWCDRSFYTANRHGISGFGFPTESYVLTESVIGPECVSHAMDMHRLYDNHKEKSQSWWDNRPFTKNDGGEYVDIRDCTFMNTTNIGGKGTEGIVQRGLSEERFEVWGCDFWHPTKPEAPGGESDAYRVYNRETWKNFNAHDNAFDGPNEGFGAPREKSGTAPKPDESLRVMSYNIHHGTGTDGVYDLQRVIDVIQSADPDVVALQEVDKNYHVPWHDAPRSNRDNQPNLLAEQLGMNAEYFVHIDYAGTEDHFDDHEDAEGQYGNLILSKHPISASNFHPFNAQQHDGDHYHNGIGEVKTDANGEQFWFYSVHPSASKVDLNKQQQEQLIRTTNKREIPRILGGDFNARYGIGDNQRQETYEILTDAYVDVLRQTGDDVYTIPASGKDGTKRRLDYIFTSSGVDIKYGNVLTNNPPSPSDHRAITADLVPSTE